MVRTIIIAILELSGKKYPQIIGKNFLARWREAPCSIREDEHRVVHMN